MRIASRKLADFRCLALAALVVCFLPTGASAWWNNSWGLRRKLVFNNSGQPSNLTNFPVLIRLDNTRVEYFRTQNQGQDIRFVDANDLTVLDHEIELWNEAGSSYVWVRIPQVDGASTTDFIYMYYDNDAAADGQNVAGVWDADFKLVQHLNEPSPAAHVDRATSDGFASNFTFISVALQGTAVGQIDGADSFNMASSHNLLTGDHPTLDVVAADSMTVEAWVRPASVATYQHVVAKEIGGAGQGVYQLVVNAGTVQFRVQDGAGNFAEAFSSTTLVAGTWYYIAGRFDRGTGVVQVFVNGVGEGTANGSAVGSLANGQTLGVGVETDGTPGFYFDGIIDEVRLSKVVGTPRSNDWLRAQNLSMRDTFITFLPEVCVASCEALVTTETLSGPLTSAVTVNAAGAFEMKFATFVGGGIEELYDLTEDPGKTLDLAGSMTGVTSPGSLHTAGMSVSGSFYNAGRNDIDSRLHVLEATPVRVRVRQDTFLQVGPGGARLPGVKGYGDYSVYPPGKIAWRWNRRTHVPILPAAYGAEYVELFLHHLGAAPLNWTPYSQTDGTFPNTGFDDFVMGQNEAVGAPGVLTDVLMILSQDWSTANFYPYDVNNLGASFQVSHERVGLFWNETDGAAGLPAGSNHTWNSLTYIKPTNFVNHLDTAVTTRSSDYRIPDPLAVLTGTSWLDASQNTGGGDDFNESEAAYVLTLDPLPGQGLRFRIDGTVAAPRYAPFFKIRQWRSLAGPASVTLDGTPLVSGVTYRSAVKPVARAHFAQDLTWYSSLEGSAAVTNPSVGSGGTVTNADTAAARFGNGARFDANGEFISIPPAGNIDLSQGALEFWYQPAANHDDGADHRLWGYSFDPTHYFFLQKQGAAAPTNGLRFELRNDTVTTAVNVASTDYSWRAGDWVHIRVSWDENAAAGNRARIFLNGGEPTHTHPSSTYTSAGMPTTGTVLIGADSNGNRSANGIIDEFRIYSTAGAPTALAHGGLTSHPAEFLADSAKNAPLPFSAVDAEGRGEYLYFGSDSKFRGLNVGLSVLGAGTGLDLVWEYWDGLDWADLESGFSFTDLTNNLTRSGNIYWTDPFGWFPYSLDAGPELYYVRAHLAAGGTYTTAPVEGLIKTDILLVQYCGDITAANQEFFIAAPIPTEVSLQSFSATARDSAVDVSWTTASEISNLGFHLYRSSQAGGPWTLLTSSLIPGLGSSPIGATYRYQDADVTNGTTYYYLLEDVETTGRTERHGPVSATPRPSSDDQSSGGPGVGPGDGSDDSNGGSGSSARITFGDPGSASLREIERGPAHVVLELRTPGFTATTQADGTVRLEIPGFDDEASLPGSLAVPVRHALVEAVAGRRVRLASMVPDDIVTFDSFRLSAAGAREVVVDEEGAVRASRASRRLLESSRRGGFAPRVWAHLLGTLFQADTKKASLELSPLRHDPASGRTLLARRLTLRVEFYGTEARERSLGGARGRQAQVQARPATKGVLAQLVVDSPGLYRVRFEDVFGPSRRNGVNARSLRLSRLGQAVPYHLEPDKAQFGSGSSLFFHSQGQSLNPQGEVVYELASGQSALRMSVASGAPSGSSMSEYLETVKLEENRFYQSALLTAPDLWLWDLLVSPVTKSYPFTVSALSASGTSSHLSVVLQGASDFEEMDHHLRLSVNGTPVAETTWDGKLEKLVETEVSAGTLVEGSNTLAIENVGDAGAAYSMVFLNRFEVTYPRLLQAETGRLQGLFDQSGRSEISGLATGPSTIGLSSASLVVDTTSVPVWLHSLEPTPTGLAFRSETGHSYLALSDTALLTPEIRKPSGAKLVSKTHRAQWVLLAPREFLSAAKPLVEQRRSQGLLTKAIALEDVYSEFGFGEPGPKPIHDFLSFAYHHWRTPPRYVVLLGDATYDPKDYLHTGVKDRVPTPIVETTYLWTASDPALAAVNGEDSLPDLAIGRLSAGTLEEAHRLVSKLLAFEQAGRTFDGKAVLVADNADLAGNFEHNQDEIAASVLLGRETRKLYLRDLGASLRSEILAAFDNGPGIVSYVGHGATAVWASENVLNNLDVASLQPQAQQPLLLTLNCLNGFFHFPPLDSLSEALVKAEGKGALAAFSPSGLSVNDAAHLFHKALLTEIESGAHARLGDAVLAAQQDYANTGAMPELLSIYHLFGDPGMKIR